MPKYIMMNKEIIVAKDFKDLRSKVKAKLKDDSYLRSFIKGVGA